MNPLPQQAATASRPAFYLQNSELSLEEFSQLCEEQPTLADYPRAKAIEKRIVLYSGETFRELEGTSEEVGLFAELHRCLSEGPGVLVIEQAWNQPDVLDRATRVFQEIIEDEKTSAAQRGDHFARPGDNDRIWNSLQKFCERDPEGFLDYHDNAALRMVCEAWLGPAFQLTEQVNVVKPGGKAQEPHRDYHLGFQNDPQVSRYPLPQQVASQLLTLQGAVAHTDMRVASGPTMLLPFSQRYAPGYLGWRREDFREYFRENFVQLPLRKGDAVFFSPALYHAAGTNTEDRDRIANLMQVSSAFGRAMESIDRCGMTRRLYPVLLKRRQQGQLSEQSLARVSACSAEGYSFPTNLDRDPPLAGSAPETMQELLQRALAAQWTPEDFNAALEAAQGRQQA